MTAPTFVTYFDLQYAAQGIAMMDSVRRWCPDASFTVLCLDDATGGILREWFPRGLQTLTIADMCRFEPRLLTVRPLRTAWEFYATMKPVVLRHVVERSLPKGGWALFTDADTYYFSSPMPQVEALDAMADTSVVLTPHRNSPTMTHGDVYGRFNAGFFLCRNDSHARRMLHDWGDDCLQWCHDRVDDGRYMNQAYLNAWPKKYHGVRVMPHLGFNVGHWNVSGFDIAHASEGITIHGQPLVFFHFARLTRTAEGHWETLFAFEHMNHPVILEHAFPEYLDAVEATARRLLARHGTAGTGSVRQQRPGTYMMRVRTAGDRNAPISWNNTP